MRAGQAVLDRLEHLPCPSVAAVHGFALGGGLELALACRYRIGADDAKFSLGLPEVMLGIHPGFGGTVRAVRLMGVRPAMELMLKGKTVQGCARARGRSARRARAAGRTQAASQTPAAAAARREERAVRREAIEPRGGAALRRAQGRRRIAGEGAARTLPRPLCHSRLVAAVRRRRRRRATRPKRDPSARSCARPPRAIWSACFCCRIASRGLAASRRIDVRRVHVIGAGVMGGDIAAWAALRGLSVTLQDRSEELIQPALARAQAYFDKRLSAPGAAAEAIRPPAPGCRRCWGGGRGCRHRGHRRKRRRQARPLRANRAAPQTERGLRNQHLQHQDRNAWPRDCRIPAGWWGFIFSIPWRRCSWSRSCKGPATRAEVARAARLIRPQARQAAAAVQKRAGFRRESNTDALHQRSAVRARGRHPRRGHRSGRDPFRHARGSDRTGRRDRIGRRAARGPRAGRGFSAARAGGAASN